MAVAVMRLGLSGESSASCFLAIDSGVDSGFDLYFLESPFLIDADSSSVAAA